MSSISGNLDDLKKQLENLRQEYSKLTGDPAPLFNVQNIDEANSAIKAVKRSISDAREEALRLEDGFEGIYGELQGILQEISKSESATNKVTKALRGTASIARDLKNEEAGFNKLSLKELQNKKAKSQSLRDEVTFQAKLLEDKIKETKTGQRALDIGLLKDKNGRDLNKSALKARATAMGMSVKELKNAAAILKGQKEGFKALKDQEKLLEKRIEKEKQIVELMGLGSAAVVAVGGALDKLGMGSLKNALGLDEVQDEMRSIAEKRLAKIRKGLEDGEKATLRFSDKMQVLKGGIKKAGEQLIKNLKDPLVIVGFLTDQLVNALIAVDKQSGALAKNFGISYDQALALNSKLNNIANVSGELNVTTANLVESFTTLNNRYGTFATLNSKTLTDFTKLTKQAYLSNEAALALQDTTYLTGKGLEESTEEFLGQSAALAAQKGLALNQKQILESIKDVSTATLLQLQGQPDALAEAIVNAKALGLSLDKVEQISSSLLNFQSSIEAELEAELLTGQQINLERARSAALMNDMRTLSDEIGKNEAVINAFVSGNRIHQQAIAKAMGVSTDQMAKMYFQHKINEGLTVEQAAKAADISIEEAKRLDVQQQITKSVERLSASLAPVLEKVAELLDNTVTMSIVMSGIVAMVGVSLVNSLASFVSNLAKALPLLKAMRKAMRLIKLESVGSAIASAYKAAMNNPQAAITGGIAGVIIGAALTTIIMSAVNRASKKDDFLLPAVGGSGYGKRMISAPEGTFALNDKDTIIAGTDLGKSESTSAPQNPPSTNINLAETNALLKQLISAVKASGNTVIEIDGNKLGKVIKQNEVSMG